jgi:ankyrin repeat protein
VRNYFKKVIYLYVFIGFSVAQAGSYEDFFIYIKRDNPDALKTLLSRGFDPNTLSPDGSHGLLLAVRDGSLGAAKALIEWPKTEVESRNKADESPLMLASLNGQVDLVKKLIERGGDVNKTGWAPLHYAAAHGHLDIMNILLEANAYIDAESPNGTTPLMMAAGYGGPDAVKLLLDAGADPRLKNQLGLTAIDFANRISSKAAADLIAASVRVSAPKGKW